MQKSKSNQSGKFSQSIADSFEEAKCGSYDLISDLVQAMAETTAKQKGQARKQDDFSRRIHKQTLMTSRRTAGNSDLRKDSIKGVDSEHNVWAE